MNKELENAIGSLRIAATRYTRNERYYDGDHDLAFATEKFENAFGTLFREFALNLCPVVCDALRDKMRIKGFSVEDADDGETSAASVHARRVWTWNRMNVRAGEIHKEGLRNGDGYAIVWPDASGHAAIFPQRAASIVVNYDDESPGSILSAAKTWRASDKLVHVNLFFPDRTERYVSRKEYEGTIPDASEMVSAGPHIENPFGRVPVFHFANNAGVGELGRSELVAAMPIQDALNKAVLDMLVAMEFTAFRQRWAAGIEIEYGDDGKAVAPFKAGVDSIWIAEDANAKFGDFAATRLEQFLRVKDGFRADIASATGTPLHYLLQTAGDVPSGESLRRAETRFIAKVRDRHASFGEVWAELMSFALAIEGRRGVRLITEWEDPSPISERDRLEDLILKRKLGLPLEQALIEAGYGRAEVRNFLTNKE